MSNGVCFYLLYIVLFISSSVPSTRSFDLRGQIAFNLSSYFSLQPTSQYNNLIYKQP